MAESALERLGRQIAEHLGIRPDGAEAPPAGFAQPPPTGEAPGMPSPPPAVEPPAMPAPPPPPPPPPARQAPVSSTVVPPSIRRQAPAGANGATRYAAKPRPEPEGLYDDPRQPRPAFLAPDQTNQIMPPNIGSSPGAAGARRLTVPEAQAQERAPMLPSTAGNQSAPVGPLVGPPADMAGPLAGPPRSAMMPEAEANPAGNMVEAERPAYTPRLAEDSQLSGMNGGLALDRTQQILGTSGRAFNRRPDPQSPKYMGLDLSRYFRRGDNAGMVAGLAARFNQPLAQVGAMEDRALRADQQEIERQKLLAKGPDAWKSSGYLSDDGQLVLLNAAGQSKLGPKVQPKANPMGDLVALERLKMDQNKAGQGTLTQPQDGPQGYGIYRIPPATGSGPPEPPRLELPLQKPPPKAGGAPRKDGKEQDPNTGKWHDVLVDPVTGARSRSVGEVAPPSTADKPLTAKQKGDELREFTDRLKTQGLPQKSVQLTELERLLPKEGDIPGIGGVVTSADSNVYGVSREFAELFGLPAGTKMKRGEQIRQALDALLLPIAHANYGASQTATEMEKFKRVVGEGRAVSTDTFRAGLKSIKRAIQADAENAIAGTTPEVLGAYKGPDFWGLIGQYRGGAQAPAPAPAPAPGPQAPAPAPAPAGPATQLPKQTVEQERDAPKQGRPVFTPEKQRRLQELREKAAGN